MEIKSMFFVPNEVLETEVFRNYKDTIKLVYLYLLKVTNQSADKEGWIRITSVALSKMSGIGVDAILRAKQQLLKDGNIEVINKFDQAIDDVRRATRIRVKGWQAVLKAANEAEEKQVRGGYFA